MPPRSLHPTYENPSRRRYSEDIQEEVVSTKERMQIQDIRYELLRYAQHETFEMPAEDARLYEYEILYEKLTIQIMTKHRVQFVQTVVRVIGGAIYVALKLMGAWWMEGWIVSISNELEDPVMQPALESYYIKYFGYARQSNDRMMMWALAKVTLMTIMANLTSQTLVS